MDAVDRGPAREEIDSAPEVLELDEKSFLKGHDYVTVLTDITGTPVLDIERDRPKEIKAFTSDICDVWLSDRFHLMQKRGEAIDRPGTCAKAGNKKGATIGSTLSRFRSD